MNSSDVELIASTSREMGKPAECITISGSNIQYDREMSYLSDGNVTCEGIAEPVGWDSQSARLTYLRAGQMGLSRGIPETM
jgi:hypothetical protein